MCRGSGIGGAGGIENNNLVVLSAVKDLWLSWAEAVKNAFANTRTASALG